MIAPNKRVFQLRPAANPKPVVVVIGGANLDITGKAAGAFRAGISNPGTITARAGGVARNIAENLARLGCRARLIAAIGADPSGKRLLAETGAAGVDLTFCIRAGAASQYVAILDASGELVAGVSDMDAVDLITPEVLRAASAAFGGADAIAADCNLDLGTLKAAADIARANNIPFAIEPVSAAKAGKIQSLLEAGFAIDFATPNEAEAACFYTACIPRVIVGLGARGARAIENGVAHHVPPFAAKLVSATGAGDAAFAAALCALLRGKPLRNAAILGQAAAALTISSERAVSKDVDWERLEGMAR